MKQIWILDGKPIQVELILSDRKTSYIAVMPDMTIEYRANLETQWTDAKAILDRKSGLIRKKISFFEQFNPKPPEHKYENGETFYYIGRQYRLKIIASRQSRLRLMGKWFIAELPNPENTDKVKKMMDKWLRDKALSRITERFQIYYEMLSHRIKEKPALSFRRMKKRWGSCSQDRILLNTELIKTPIICIDYIIVHELCHVIYPKHSKAFYRRLSQIMPDWKQRKNRLERSII
ncbi:MAG TPA: SprT family zinc-dependent metalloprotease [Candidatus Cloacimonadota bacterium]|nr:SprT family zinc-dependent metalloprotease [Candidatus Cloacimonadota bacterium]